MKKLLNNCLLFQKYGFAACFLLLAACDKPAPEYVNSGDPERLLIYSSETVILDLDSKKSLTKLSELVVRDRPVMAELGCSLVKSRCAQAKEIFERNGVPLRFASEKNNNVKLSYDRVIARDCEQHFIDNMSGSRSFTHPAFGCAIAGNMVQMVSDKRQFANPDLLDFPDAEKLNQSYRDYLKPSYKREVKAAELNSTSSAR